jgi:hypothetical protein
MNLEGYEPFQPGVVGPLGSVSRPEARESFKRRMASKSTRIEMLGRLVRINGGDELSHSESAIQMLNDWFVEHIEIDPANPGQPQAWWNSISNDVALYLGEYLILECPWLEWQMWTKGKRDVSYQRPVVVGFRNAGFDNFSWDVHRQVASYSHRIMRAKGHASEYGKIQVKGLEVDVDAVLSTLPERGIEHDWFLSILRNAKEKS